MAQTVSSPGLLFTGMRMEREEFLRRWEALPDLKNAELIEGTVFVSSPVGQRHSDFDGFITSWLTIYAGFMPGVRSGHNATCLMLESAPQPDVYLRILPEHGGAAREVDNFLKGAPELIVEISESSYSHDFGPKRALYQRAGVREYLTIDTIARQLVWRCLEDGSYIDLEPGEDGIFRSRMFQGLWLDPQHLWARDAVAMLALLEQARNEPV